MPSAVPIFLKMADEKQVIYFTWPYLKMCSKNEGFRLPRVHCSPVITHVMILQVPFSFNRALVLVYISVEQAKSSISIYGVLYRDGGHFVAGPRNFRPRKFGP